MALVLQVPPSPQQHLAQLRHRLEQLQPRLQETQRRFEAIKDYVAETHRLVYRLLWFAIVVTGFCVLGTGFLVWQGLTMRHESAARWQAGLTNTPTIAAQTILERARSQGSNP